MDIQLKPTTQLNAFLDSTVCTMHDLWTDTASPLWTASTWGRVWHADFYTACQFPSAQRATSLFWCFGSWSGQWPLWISKTLFTSPQCFFLMLLKPAASVCSDLVSIPSLAGGAPQTPIISLQATSTNITCLEDPSAEPATFLLPLWSGYRRLTVLQITRCKLETSWKSFPDFILERMAQSHQVL